MNQHAWLNELGLEEETRKTFGRDIILKLVMYSLLRITNTHESYILIKRAHLFILLLLLLPSASSLLLLL
jgi:hypothetical protein